MTLRQVIVRTGGTGGPGVTDSIALYAKVGLTEQNAEPTDDLKFYARVGISDSSPGQTDVVTLYAKVNLADTAAAQADALNRLGITGQENNATPSDDYMKLRLGLPDSNDVPQDTLSIGARMAETAGPQSDVLNDVNLNVEDTNLTPDDVLTLLRLGLGNETNLVPTDTVRTGFAGGGLSDTSATPTESRSSVVTTWAASQSTSGQAPTNPANAVGQQNGTNAVVQGSNALIGGNASTLTLTIPVASIPASPTRILRVWGTVAVGLAGGSATFTNTGGTPASGNLPMTTTSPVDVTLTTIGTSLTVTFTSAAGLLGQNVYTVDAVGVVTTPTI